MADIRKPGRGLVLLPRPSFRKRSGDRPAGAAKEAAPQTDPAPTYFFRHVPKTAGTSLTTVLWNVFGDDQCHRFVEEGLEEDAVLARLSDPSAPVALASGHLPLTQLPARDALVEFTILRDPVDRVLSLRRFLKGRPEAARRQLGLSDAVTLEELIASRNPTVFSQVRNGMTRFFCRDPAFTRETQAAFWEPSPPEGVLTDVCDTVATAIVGVVEDMPGALRRLGDRLGAPYALEVGLENDTDPSADRTAPEDVERICRLNAADIALYRRMVQHLARGGPSRWESGALRWDRRTLFRPSPGRNYQSRSIPGRQGFHRAEGQSICWIGPQRTARLHIDASESGLALTLSFYAITPSYPASGIRVRVDGEPWRCVIGADAEQTIRLRLADLPRRDQPYTVEIVQPFAIPVQAIDPGSPDERTLGLGLTAVMAHSSDPDRSAS